MFLKRLKGKLHDFNIKSRSRVGRGRDLYVQFVEFAQQICTLFLSFGETKSSISENIQQPRIFVHTIGLIRKCTLSM